MRKIFDTPNSETPPQLKLYGKKLGVELLRPHYPDGSTGGVVVRCNGGLLTVKHVVENNKLGGFHTQEGSHMDIAFKPDPSIKGLSIGFVNQLRVSSDVHLLASSIENPTVIQSIEGSIGIYFAPTPLRPFQSIDRDLTQKYFKPGLSGSPLVYKNHIIGVVPFLNENSANELAVFAFMGVNTKDTMKSLGMPFEEI